MDTDKPRVLVVDDETSITDAVATALRYEVMLEPTGRHDLVLLDLPIAAPRGSRLNADRLAIADEAVDSVLSYTGTSSPVAYVEAWYVDSDVRRQGIGRALFRAAEDWARAQGLTEIASDAELHNEVSIAAHKAIGYTETDRIVCFLRSL